MANGVWTIVIQGTGPYKNDTDKNAYQYDADKAIPNLVDLLSSKGQNVTSSSFYNSQPASVTTIPTVHGRGR